MSCSARLLIQCADQPGIVAAVTRFLFEHDANVTHLDQHSTEMTGGLFYMRAEFQLPDLEPPNAALRTAFAAQVGDPFDMHWSMVDAGVKKRMVIFASRTEHTLQELLWRHARGDLAAEITAVISNHAATAVHAERFGVPFRHIPVTPDSRADAEQAALEIIGQDTDLIVLARYMQILSPAFVDRFPQRIINIHHSFLPAFVGADPYRQAYERGVKLIGATAHYVTSELDQGPIIEQDVSRVTHRDDVNALRAMGRDIERRVLARAVHWHLEDRVIVSGARTVVFR
ncbi:formyltetrahydrofolate deformylase [Abyssibacter sp.]|uniref:formyltetrahydrofolate deformylase n=1 Tax=Abyssibacter sp. TaxID=2320200 RepID=UPI0025C397BE|nr:formyltetrahydrofolate deformylase [Abyssibacter sp.]MCK5858763.1 formyltetrahydrofolate deformylase [Abyssibacter sp.]